MHRISKWLCRILSTEGVIFHFFLQYHSGEKLVRISKWFCCILSSTDVIFHFFQYHLWEKFVLCRTFYQVRITADPLLKCSSTSILHCWMDAQMLKFLKNLHIFKWPSIIFKWPSNKHANEDEKMMCINFSPFCRKPHIMSTWSWR